MGRPLADIADRPTSCLAHPGSKIYLDRPARRWGGFHETRAFRCNPPDRADRHLMPSSSVARSTTTAHPHHGKACPACSHADEGGGPTVAAGYTFAVTEIAEALLRAGRGGDSFANIAAGARAEAYRPALDNRKRGRRMAARRPYTPPMPYPQPRQKLVKRFGPPQPYPYDYSKAKVAPRLTDVVPSRSANLVSSWIDAFAPSLIEAHRYQAWPVAIAVDSMPLKRRRIAVRPKDGTIGRVSAGERNGEVLVASDCTTKPATPVLIALEGGKDEHSWINFFSRLPGATPPVWIVSDIDSAIEKAVKVAFPTAIHYRCHRHLKERIHKALTEDGIPECLPAADAAALGIDLPDPGENARRQRDPDFAGYVEHPLWTLVRFSLKTVEGWEAFVAAVEATIPAYRLATRTWIADRDALVRQQIVYVAANPGMPKTTGAVEATITRVKLSVEPRSEFFRNAGRLDNLLGLIRLEAGGFASQRRYTDLISARLEQRAVRPIDWRASRDEFGATSSIDQMIDASIIRKAVAQAEQEREERARLKGSAPIVPGGPAATACGQSWRTAGLTVADIPVIRDQWPPDLNGGVLASQVKAWSRDVVLWRCLAHQAEGHEHIFKAAVLGRTSKRPPCPKCAHAQPCPTYNFAFFHPTVADEWYEPKNAGKQRPEDTLPMSIKYAFWKCLNSDHVPYEARFAQRANGSRCPECVDDERWARGSDTLNKRNRERRRLARDARQNKPKAAIVALPVPADPPIHAVADIAKELGVGGQTIRNWIKKGRLQGTQVGGPNGIFLVPESELVRIRAERAR